MDNTKYILGLFMVIILTTSVSAISVGQVFNQAQIDNVNVETVDLECQLDGVRVISERGNPERISYDMSCLALKRELNIYGVETGNYVVYRKPFLAEFRVYRLIECLNNYNWAICRDQGIVPYVREKLLMNKDYIRGEIADYQTPMDLSNLNFTDINLEEWL